VYVQAFPAANAKWPVSTSGGAFPAWRRDGKELFYISAARRVMSVAVSSNGTFEPGLPRPLFQIEGIFPPTVPRHVYGVSADGQRFLIITPTSETASSPITVDLNWRAALKK
jgi:hypothetical protein